MIQQKLSSQISFMWNFSIIIIGSIHYLYPGKTCIPYCGLIAHQLCLYAANRIKIGVKRRRNELIFCNSMQVSYKTCCEMFKFMTCKSWIKILHFVWRQEWESSASSNSFLPRRLQKLCSSYWHSTTVLHAYQAFRTLLRTLYQHIWNIIGKPNIFRPEIIARVRLGRAGVEVWRSLGWQRTYKSIHKLLHHLYTNM